MVWLQVVALLCVSVAVQVRLVLLTSLPLTGRAWSAKLTVRLLSHASLKAGLPKRGVAGHSMLSSAVQLAPSGAALSITVMVWLQVVELLCASVAVQVRLVLLAWLPLKIGRASCRVSVWLVVHAALVEGVPKVGVGGHWVI